MRAPAGARLLAALFLALAALALPALALAEADAPSWIPPVAPPAAPTGPALVLPVGGDLRGEEAEQARRAVSAALAAAGQTELPRAELLLRVSPARLDGCATLACARALGLELGAARVVAVALWAREDGHAGSVAVSVADENGARVGSAEVGPGGLDAAAERALREALGGEAAPVQVATPRPDPEQSAENSSGASENSSAGQGGEGNSEAPPENEWDRLVRFVFPVLLGLLSATAVGLGIYALTEESCELRGASGICLRGDAPNPSTGAALLIGGGLGLAGAVVWLVYGGQPGFQGEPIELTLRPSITLDGGGVARAGVAPRAQLELGVRW